MSECPSQPMSTRLRTSDLGEHYYPEQTSVCAWCNEGNPDLTAPFVGIMISPTLWIIEQRSLAESEESFEDYIAYCFPAGTKVEWNENKEALISSITSRGGKIVTTSRGSAA